MKNLSPLAKETMDQITRVISQKAKQAEFQPVFTTQPVTKADVIMEYRYTKWRHRFSTRFHITRDQAFELQCEFGYHPCGYGLHNIVYNEKGTTWECSSSSD